jgi:purine-binding chemotaxis protein CheW
MEEIQEKDELLQLVGFKVNGEEFGVDILQVQEIIRMMKITKVPQSKDFIDGVINLRGRVIPVVNLRQRLGMEKIDENNKTRIIVVEIGAKTIGFIVDEVSEVLRIPKSITEPPPKALNGIDSTYITAVAKLEDRILILLDLEKLFSEEEKEELQVI